MYVNVKKAGTVTGRTSRPRVSQLTSSSSTSRGLGHSFGGEGLDDPAEVHRHPGAVSDDEAVEQIDGEDLAGLGEPAGDVLAVPGGADRMVAVGAFFTPRLYA